MLLEKCFKIHTSDAFIPNKGSTTITTATTTQHFRNDSVSKTIAPHSKKTSRQKGASWHNLPGRFRTAVGLQQSSRDARQNKRKRETEKGESAPPRHFMVEEDGEEWSLMDQEGITWLAEFLVLWQKKYSSHGKGAFDNSGFMAEKT